MRTELPLAYRLVLDEIVESLDGATGFIGARVIGDERLSAALADYVEIRDDRDTLIALGTNPGDLETQLVTERPRRVLTLSSGALGGLVDRLRREAIPCPGSLSPETWRRLGYVARRDLGVQGIGWLLWAAAERATSSIGQFAIADRCRIGMLRSSTTLLPTSRVSSVRVREYRRVA